MALPYHRSPIGTRLFISADLDIVTTRLEPLRVPWKSNLKKNRRRFTEITAYSSNARLCRNIVYNEFYVL